MHFSLARSMLIWWHSTAERGSRCGTKKSLIAKLAIALQVHLWHLRISSSLGLPAESSVFGVLSKRVTLRVVGRFGDSTPFRSPDSRARILGIARRWILAEGRLG